MSSLYLRIMAASDPKNKHDETLTLPMHENIQLQASQYKQKTQYPLHIQHKHTTYFNTPRLKKAT